MSFSFGDNPLFEMPHQGKHQPHIVVVILVLVGIMFVSFVIPAIIAKIAYPDSGGTEALFDSVLFLIIPFLLITLGLWGWLVFYEKRSFRTLGFLSKGGLKKFMTGFGAGFGMLIITIGLMYLAGSIELEDTETRSIGLVATGSIILFLFGYLVQCSTEEIVFRGWLMPVIGVRHSPLLGIIVSTLIFVTFHGSLKPMVIFQLTLFSFFLVMYCLYEGGIWGICGWHTAWNWAQNNFFGVELTGHDSTSGTLFNLKASGPALLSGGGFGPEASIMGTVVLLAGIIVLYVLLKKQAIQYPRAN